MSLVRLLSAGRSLVGLQTPTSRYRMRSKNPLPKFGSDKNPFAAPAPTPATPINDPAPPLPQPARVLTPAEIAAARLKETKVLPASITTAPTVSPSPLTPALKPVEAGPGVVALAFAAVRGWVKRCGQKLKSLPRPWRKSPKPAARTSPPIPRHDQTPVQGELSLDRVRVVRNDLSEADVEIVPAKSPTKMKSEPANPAPVARARGLIETAGTQPG